MNDEMINLCCLTFDSYEEAISYDPSRSGCLRYMQVSPFIPIEEFDRSTPPTKVEYENKEIHLKEILERKWVWVPQDPDEQAYVREVKLQKNAKVFQAHGLVSVHDIRLRYVPDKDTIWKNLTSQVMSEAMNYMEEDKEYKVRFKKETIEDPLINGCISMRLFCYVRED